MRELAFILSFAFLVFVSATTNCGANDEIDPLLVEKIRIENSSPKFHTELNKTESERKHAHNRIIEWFEKEAATGNTQAQYDLACIYRNGEGVPQDYAKSVLWLLKAAEGGHLIAQYDLGISYARGEGVSKDLAKSVQWHTTAARSGLSISQHILGLAYLYGNGVDQDSKIAFMWFQEAANRGWAEASAYLGYCYLEGLGVSKSPKSAVEWFKRAAEKDDGYAQMALGILYTNGVGVIKDEVLGLAWTYLASKNGYAKATEIIPILEKDLNPASIVKAREIAHNIQSQLSHSLSEPSKDSIDKKTSKPDVMASGSGVIVSRQGHILTAYHVVHTATRISVVSNGKTYDATIISTDQDNDVALLKCEGEFTPAPVAHSSNVRVGAKVFTIGYPNISIQGLNAKVTTGEINSMSGIGDDPKLLQISVAVQPGNSGGALFDTFGNVIGIISSKLDSAKTAAVTGSLPQDVNYAIKSRYFVEMLVKHKSHMPEPEDNKSSSSLEDSIEKSLPSAVLILTY